MTLATIKPYLIVGPPGVTGQVLFNTWTLDASGEYVSYIIRAPKTGTIDRIHFNAGSKTADGDGLRLRVETVDATTGLPTGTLVGGSSEVTVATVTANGWNRGGAGLNAAVTKNDVIALVMVSPAGTTYNGQIRPFTLSLPLHENPGRFPYNVYATPTPTKYTGANDQPLIFAVEYDDGTIPHIKGALPLSGFVGHSIATNTTPDEIGNLISLPYKCRAAGGWVGNVDSPANFDLVLYDASNNVLASVSVDKDLFSDNNHGACYQTFDTPVELSANTSYRIVIKPTTTTAITTGRSCTINTSVGTTALREAMLDSIWKFTERTDAGSWTDTDDKYASVGLLIDQLDDGAGGAASPSSVAQVVRVVGG